MTRNEANVFLACILETVDEVPGGAPSGHMYAALMGRISLEDYDALIQVCKDAGLVTIARNHLVTITPKGSAIAAKSRAFRQEQKSA